MRLRFDYDRDGLDVDLPDRNLLAIIEADQPRTPRDAQGLLRQAIEDPEDTPAFATLAQGKASACIAVPDVTRPLPLPLILRELLSALERAGIPRNRLLILIATGLHRPNHGVELEAMLGADIAASYRIENHDARDMAGHVPLGETGAGATALVDRRFVEAELRIVVGLVEPHFMAGYSGGRKLVCPGLCAEETIRAFHAYELLSSPNACNCRLEDNPVHAMSTDIAKRSGVHFSVNVVLDSARNVYGVHAGALETSFLSACRTAASLTTYAIPHAADIVVASGGGYPLDATWYQSVKGLVAAAQAVRPGGIIVLATSLSEGVGSDDYRRLLAEENDLERFLERLRTPGYYRPEQWQLQLFAQVVRKARVMLYSHNVSADAAREWRVEPVRSVEAGISLALEELGADASLLAMPHGPYIIPVPPDS